MLGSIISIINSLISRLRIHFLRSYFQETSVRFLERRGIKLYTYEDLDYLIDCGHVSIDNRGRLVWKEVCVHRYGIIQLNKSKYFIGSFRNRYPFLKCYADFLKGLRMEEYSSLYFHSYPYAGSFNIFHLIVEGILPIIAENKVISVPQTSEFGRSLYKEFGVNFIERNFTVAKVNNLTTVGRVDSVLGIGNLKCVFVSRLGERRTYRNYKVLIELLESLNIQVVDFKYETVESRKKLLANTDILIGEYGAGFLKKRLTSSRNTI
jgi:hypothetical protein